jgi:hypothetical protein
VSVSGVNGDRLHLNQVVSSGGPFPVSIAVSGSLAYVLNAGLTGNVHGYRIANGGLVPIPGSTRSLGLNNSNPPNFPSSPAEVGFTPVGTHLVVTTKGNGTVDVFSVNPGGLLSGQPAKNPIADVPFGFIFDPAGRLALVNTVTPLAVHPEQVLGADVVRLHVFVAQRPGRRDSVRMLDLAEVAGQQPEKRRAVHLGVAAHVIVQLGPEGPVMAVIEGLVAVYFASPKTACEFQLSRSRVAGNDHYDVLVIGSGPGGATTAARVAETGKRVLMLERGDFLHDPARPDRPARRDRRRRGRWAWWSQSRAPLR